MLNRHCTHKMTPTMMSIIILLHLFLQFADLEEKRLFRSIDIDFLGCESLAEAQLAGRLFSPSDMCKKLSHLFLLHFLIGIDSYDHHAKYQGVFP